jgi:biopolymer transport protein ExbD
MRIPRRALWLAALGAAVAAPAGAEPANHHAPAALRVDAGITPHGVWLAAGPRVRCFVPRKAGALDAPAVEGELRRFRSADRSAIVISAVRGVTYQEIVRVMDVGVKVGLIDVQIGAGSDLAAVFHDSAAARRSAAAHCPSPPPPPPPRPSSRPAPSEPPLARLTRPPPPAELARRKELLERQVPLPPWPPKPDLSKAPVIVVTPTEVTMRGRTLCRVAGLASGSGAIQPLLEALEDVARTGDAADAETRGVAVLQADESLDAVVIERVLASSRAAGYDDVLFAVK